MVKRSAIDPLDQLQLFGSCVLLLSASGRDVPSLHIKFGHGCVFVVGGVADQRRYSLDHLKKVLRLRSTPHRYQFGCR